MTKQLWLNFLLSDSPNESIKSQESTVTVKIAQIMVNRIGNYLISLFPPALQTAPPFSTENIKSVLRNSLLRMDLEERIVRLEHREAIKTLRANYCYYADEHDWESFVSLFTEDVHFEFGPIGEFDGREEILENLAPTIDREHSFLVHMVHNPIIEFDGEETASGRWYFEVPATFRDGEAGWIQGTYWDDYRHVDGEWLFEEIRADFNYFAEYDKGWAEIVE